MKNENTIAEQSTNLDLKIHIRSFTIMQFPREIKAFSTVVSLQYTGIKCIVIIIYQFSNLFETAAGWKVFGKHAGTLRDQSGETYLSLRRLPAKGKAEASKTSQSFRLRRNLLSSDFFSKQHFV